MPPGQVAGALEGALPRCNRAVLGAAALISTGASFRQLLTLLLLAAGGVLTLPENAMFGKLRFAAFRKADVCHRFMETGCPVFGMFEARYLPFEACPASLIIGSFAGLLLAAARNVRNLLHAAQIDQGGRPG